MIEVGKIIGVSEDVATVRFARRGECDRCRVCTVAKDGAHVEIRLKNTLELNAGDYVKVEVYKKQVFTASILIYVIPLMLTALGAGLGSLAGVAASILLAIAGLVVGLAFALPIDVCVLRKKSGYAPRMTEACREIDYINAKQDQN